jgi:hypothetical protein
LLCEKRDRPLDLGTFGGTVAQAFGLGTLGGSYSIATMTTFLPLSNT